MSLRFNIQYSIFKIQDSRFECHCFTSRWSPCCRRNHTASMLMALGCSSRPGDARLTHRARVESARALASCTLRTISNAHPMPKAGLAVQGRSSGWLAEEACSSRSSQFDYSLRVMRDASRCTVYPSRCAPGEVTKELKHLGDYSSDYDAGCNPLARATSARSRVSNTRSPHTQLAAVSCSSPAVSCSSPLRTQPLVSSSLRVYFPLPPPSRPPSLAVRTRRLATDR